MTTGKEYEWHNVLPPLKNSTSMVSQANIVVGATYLCQDLASLFRGLDDGHMVTMQADGAKIYVAMGANEVGKTGIVGLSMFAIDPGATGVGTQVCFPIPDGVMLPFFPQGGQELGKSGVFPTMVQNYNVLHARVASGGVATAFLRIYRSSMGPNQAPGFFRPV